MYIIAINFGTLYATYIIREKTYYITKDKMQLYQ